ncbi:hypothetical protein ACROYT_G019922 [Oculina patagonica]
MSKVKLSRPRHSRQNPFEHELNGRLSVSIEIQVFSLDGKTWVIVFWWRGSVSGLLFRSLAQTATEKRGYRLPELRVRGRLHRHSLPGLEIQAWKKR